MSQLHVRQYGLHSLLSTVSRGSVIPWTGFSLFDSKAYMSLSHSNFFSCLDPYKYFSQSILRFLRSPLSLSLSLSLSLFLLLGYRCRKVGNDDMSSECDIEHTNITILECAQCTLCMNGTTTYHIYLNTYKDITHTLYRLCSSLATIHTITDN